MSSKEAQRIADSKGLDLVKISPTAVPPVCKIMDYNKFMYEKAKKEKEAKKNQKVTLLKEVQLSLNTEDHDLNTKMNHAKRFLGDGNKVKVALKLRSREIQRPELGLVLMEKFANGVSELGVIEKPAKLEGRTMIMILAANKPLTVQSVKNEETHFYIIKTKENVTCPNRRLAEQPRRDSRLQRAVRSK